MDDYQPSYATVTTLGDFGPWISKLVLTMPTALDTCDVTLETFNVFCARHEPDGSVLMRQERGADHAAACEGDDLRDGDVVLSRFVSFGHGGGVPSFVQYVGL